MKDHKKDPVVVPGFGLDSIENELFPETEALFRQRLNIAEEGWKAPSFYSNIQFFDQIRMGDYQGILEGSKNSQTQITLADAPLFSENPRKNIEYAQIACIALAMQAAIEGGLDPATAYSIASVYYRKVGHGQSLEEYHALNGEMTQAFARAVHQEHLSFHTNPIVRECDRHLMNHLTSPFSLPDLTEALGYSAAYLQRVYKKETGQTLTGMLRLARIRLAMYWLQHTDVPISNIAQQLCFASHSHFGAVFKEVTGMSPREYRKTTRG